MPGTIAPAADAPAREDPDHLGYRPAIDGLRAVAVLAVVAYHDDYGWARGGFLGVDTFFVLSGFLITTLLLLEHRRTGGIGLLAFWGRRLRRLVPALLLVLGGVAAFCALWVTPYEVGRFRGDAVASLFYVTNWRFVADGSSYFDLVASPSPVKHLWSLAIEEQFYLVWPVVVVGCLALGRRGVRVLTTVTVAGTVASVVVMARAYAADDPSRAYYGTDSRVHTVLVGALLAILLTARPVSSPRARRLVTGFGLAGAVVVGWAMVTWSDTGAAYYRGGSLAFAVAAAAVVATLAHARPDGLGRLLAHRPLVALGRISYGVYLWHWPVGLALAPPRIGFDGPALDVLRLVTTLAIATASYRLVEMPIRRGALGPRASAVLAPTAAALTAVAILAGTTGARPLPGYLRGIALPTAAATATAIAPEPERPVPVRSGSDDPGAQNVIPIFACPDATAAETAEAEAEVTRLGNTPSGSRTDAPLRVLVIGDSLACSLAVGLEPAAAGAISVEQVAMIGCGVIAGAVWDDREPFPARTGTCPPVVIGWIREALARFAPDVVVWLSTWERMNLVDGPRLAVTGTPAWSRLLDARFGAVVDEITAGGARVVMATVAAPAPAGLAGGGRITSPEFDWRVGELNAELRRLAATRPNRVRLVDVAADLCPEGPPCPKAVAGGLEPRLLDGAHFTPAGAVWASGRMLPAILGR
ncbi:MAG: acyltransferase family protein [Actinomycetota bacterium]